MMAVAAQNSTVNVAIAAWYWPSMFDIETKMKGINSTSPSTGGPIR